MIRKSKALGLALIAVAALGGIAASVAQAGKFDVGATPAVITASTEINQEAVFTISGESGSASAKCQSSTLEGTAQGTTIEEATLTPTFGIGKGNSEEVQGCTLLGLKAQVLTNGCKFTVTGAGQAERTFLVDIVGCTEGKQIEIRGIACTVKIAQQNSLSHIVGTNLAGEKEVTLAMTLGGIVITQTGAACTPGSGPVALTANYIAKAFKDLGSELITLHSHQYNRFKCGEQVKLVST
jgi:hypothetical protein